MSFTKLKTYFFKAKTKNLLISVTTALAILPFLTTSSKRVISGISSGNEALGIFYYPRIFSLDQAWLEIGNYFTRSTVSLKTSAEFGMLGDLIERIFFKIFSENIVITYKIISLIYLSLWLYFLTRLVSEENISNFLKSSILVSLALIIFFGNKSLININYGFSRIISPQVSILIWILTIYGVHEFFRNSKLGIKKSKFLILFPLLILLSSLTYLFTFLALLGVAVVFGLYLLYIKEIKKITIFLILSLTSCIPFGISTYTHQSNLVFSQVLERMGIFESRLPGSIKTLMLCLVIFLLIFIYNKLTTNKLSNNPFVLTILICTIGLIVASQSNVITNKSIQFYHFETYSYILLILVIVKLFLLTMGKQTIIEKLQIRSRKIPISVLVSLLLLHFLFTNIKIDPSNDYKTFFVSNFSKSSNLIVDISVLDYSIPIYTKSKVLYQGDIIAYNFTNAEIMNRYFVNSGCPKQISFEGVPGLIEYRIQPTLQKGNQVFKYLSFINLEHRFRNLYLPYIEEAKEIETNIGLEVEEFFRKNRGGDCLQLARQFGIDYVIFDRESSWSEFFSEKDSSKFVVNKKDIYVVKLSE